MPWTWAKIVRISSKLNDLYILAHVNNVLEKKNLEFLFILENKMFQIHAQGYALKTPPLALVMMQFLSRVVGTNMGSPTGNPPPASTSPTSTSKPLSAQL